MTDISFKASLHLKTKENKQIFTMVCQSVHQPSCCTNSPYNHNNHCSVPYLERKQSGNSKNPA